MNIIKPLSPVVPAAASALVQKQAPETVKKEPAALKEVIQEYIPGKANAQTPEETKEREITWEDAQQIAEVMNEISRMFNQQLNFEVFEDTQQLYVQIVDRNTREVIKQIPSQEMLEMSAKIREMVGIILDKYV